MRLTGALASNSAVKAWWEKLLILKIKINIVKIDISDSINSNREKPISYLAEYPEINSNPLNNKVIFINKATIKITWNPSNYRHSVQ